MKRPSVTIVLALLSFAAAVSSLVVTLQFLGIVSWGEEKLDFWGGKWAGVLLFGLEAAIALLVAYGWLTLKPWAFTITLLMALAGIFIPLSSLAAGTETWSTALAPILVNAAVMAMVLRPDVRRATSPSAAPESI